MRRQTPRASLRGRLRLRRPLRRRKRGRDSVAGVPSRFIAEMKLDEATTKEDPREKLKALRAEFAKKSAASAAAAAAAGTP